MESEGWRENANVSVVAPMPAGCHNVRSIQYFAELLFHFNFDTERLVSVVSSPPRFAIAISKSRAATGLKAIVVVALLHLSNYYWHSHLETSISASHPVTDTTTSATTMLEKAILGAGCFWGVEKSFRKKFGGDVARTIQVGYSGGSVANPSYRDVCSGNTGHAEVIQFEFDPATTSYPAILDFFFRMHEPTTLNRQGNDRGTQYRSCIIYTTEEQRKQAEEAIARVKPAYGGSGVATTVEPFKAFYTAEDYHQDYLTVNPHGYECSTHFERSWDKIAKEFGGVPPQ
ncbi:Peptide-methionine (S)-S-oxide reductase [Irineochytrium annulatum]|nr:Peptide-methionine (S)-S-oxide reductase [Irineochytrium annulatum]